jgi:SAM-dependent methyltransferase
MIDETGTYIGEELELFAAAKNWKAYLAAQMSPFFGPRVLEVGAGMGTTAAALCRGAQREWVCLEPDLRLLAEVEKRLAAGELPACCRPRAGTLADFAESELFDTILYVDVLEHIEKDREEAALAYRHLAPGGHLIVLSPAHPFLYTPFDKAIGHYRRYTRKSLAAISPAGSRRVRWRYLDAVGFFASLANRLMLSQSMPTARQLWVWDRLMVPFSRCFDPLFFFSFGKSVLGVWRREA